MGSHLERTLSGVQFEGSHPGCTWGIFHILDYHHWHHVKKKLPRNKHSGGRHARCKVSQKTNLKRRDNEVQELMDSAAEPLLDEQHSTVTSPASTKKRPGKARIKELIAEEMTKEEKHRYWNLSHAVRIWLRRIIPAHHLEHSDKYLGEIHADGKNPIIPVQKSAGTSSTGLQVFPEKSDRGLEETDQLKGDVSNNQFKECVDALEVFKVNKEYFLKILQEPNIGTKHFNGLQNSNSKARLTKSVSYPAPNSQTPKNVRPRTVKHKQNESWSFPKGEKLVAASQASEFGASKSQKEYHLKSIPFMADNNSIGSTVRQESNFYSLDSSQGVSQQGWNHKVINQFKEIKQRIMHALKENRKESNHTSTEQVLERDPSGKELSKRPEISDYDISRGRPDYIQRTSSLNESLGRYTELFERSFGGETKWLHSKSRSLKLTNESKIPSSGSAPKPFRRRLSLPELDAFCSFLNEAPSDALSSEMPVMADNDHYNEPKAASTPVEPQTIEPIHADLETEFQKDIQSSNDLMVVGNYKGTATGESILHQDQKIGLTMSLSRELAHPCTELAEPGPVSDLETCFPDDITSIAELPSYEGLGLNPRGSQMDEPDTSAYQQTKSSTGSLPAFGSIVTPESVENHFLHFHLDDADFNYVRLVLELSGFNKTDHLGTWYSLDQPLSPSLFKELEALLHPELEDYGEENECSCDDHRLLFDLINDTLLEVYERSFTYFPKAFSFNHHIRPMPKGHHLLEEVWDRLSSHLSLRPELDQSLDDVVARDMTKGDGWMNLQFDNECVALELEDLIFDQLLDELICC